MALTTLPTDLDRSYLNTVGPYTKYFAVTPHDTNYIADGNDKLRATRAIMIDTTGPVVVNFIGNPTVDATITITGGVMYPFAVVRIKDTGTTATTVHCFR